MERRKRQRSASIKTKALDIVLEAERNKREMDLPISPQIQLAINEAVAKEVLRANEAYAMKLVERILFGILAIAGVSATTYFVNLLLKK